MLSKTFGKDDMVMR